jgi:hypothetical protein
MISVSIVISLEGRFTNNSQVLRTVKNRGAYLPGSLRDVWIRAARHCDCECCGTTAMCEVATVRVIELAIRLEM